MLNVVLPLPLLEMRTLNLIQLSWSYKYIKKHNLILWSSLSSFDLNYFAKLNVNCVAHCIHVFLLDLMIFFKWAIAFCQLMTIDYRQNNILISLKMLFFFLNSVFCLFSVVFFFTKHFSSMLGAKLDFTTRCRLIVLIRLKSCAETAAGFQNETTGWWTALRSQGECVL